MIDVLIVGGGLAGLVNSILLSRAGLNVVLVEKNTFPFHRVCGEYISNEVIPFLEGHNLFPAQFEPARIDRLQLTSTGGNSFKQTLDLGGFGISRFQFDHWLSEQATEAGVTLIQNTRIKEVTFTGDHFYAASEHEEFEAKLAIVAHGKRSMLDKRLNRPFLQKKSPYVGVKYHARVAFDPDLIALHNFQGGYCGVSRVEDDRVNICYMTHRDQVKAHGSIPELERNVLFKNPFLKRLFQQSEFLFEQPLVINEITFEKKEPVFNHIFMSGDAAGSITPLCGNGMALAIHSAKLLSETILKNWHDGNFNRELMEESYARDWNQLFARRLWAGRQIQTLFGSSLASELAVFTGKYLKPVARTLIHHTHGQPFS